MSVDIAVELLIGVPSVLALFVGGLWVLGRSLRSDRREAVEAGAAAEGRQARIEERITDLRHDVRGLDERVRGLESRRD